MIETFVRVGANDNGLLVGWSSDNSGPLGLCIASISCGAAHWHNKNVRAEYKEKSGYARLFEKIGIDNDADANAFYAWWADHSAACQRAFAGYCRGGENDYTFAEWVRDAFLDFIEPMSEDDIQAQEEYNDNYQQEWLVMGEERSAKVELNFSFPTMDGKDGEPHKFIYTAGDYPTFKRFCYLGWANQEVIKWTGH